jgi:hypothetical protein
MPRPFATPGRLPSHPAAVRPARCPDTHTNTIEGFFGNLKTGMRGNYKMFEALLSRASST